MYHQSNVNNDKEQCENSNDIGRLYSSSSRSSSVAKTCYTAVNSNASNRKTSIPPPTLPSSNGIPLAIHHVLKTPIKRDTSLGML
jgi:hypothetical protein